METVKKIVKGFIFGAIGAGVIFGIYSLVRNALDKR